MGSRRRPVHRQRPSHGPTHMEGSSRYGFSAWRSRPGGGWRDTGSYRVGQISYGGVLMQLRQLFRLLSALVVGASVITVTAAAAPAAPGSESHIVVPLPKPVGLRD